MALTLEPLGTFLIACRVSACVMLMPGYSSVRVPARVRLFLALILSVVVAPLVDTSPAREIASDVGLVRPIIGETAIGAAIGLACRLYISALEFAGTTIANYIGLNGLGSGLEHESEPTIASLMTVLATLLLLMLDMHLYAISGIVDSYASFPIGGAPEPDALLSMVLRMMQAAFLICLQISAPFLIFGIVINVAFGLLGKLIPQVPSYFVSVPFTIAGGLLLLYFAAGTMMKLFTGAVSEGLSHL